MSAFKSINLSREKHLDHMVRVVPFIVFCYAIQSYVIYQISPTPFSQVSLSVLGGFLACMIAGFITYDVKHQVVFFEDHLHVKFLMFSKRISYNDITEINVKDPGETFSNLTLRTPRGKMTFYFIDDAEKLKEWIEVRNGITSKAA
jgi:hypothetical protein